MITNFEDYTDELSLFEKEYILPELTRILITCIGKENVITNRQIVNRLLDEHAIVNHTAMFFKTTGPRVRHMIHILRVTDTIPLLIATGNGYYISNNEAEILSYIQSVDDRIRHIYRVRRALRRQLRNKREVKHSLQMDLFK